MAKRQRKGVKAKPGKVATPAPVADEAEATPVETPPEKEMVPIELVEIPDPPEQVAAEPLIASPYELTLTVTARVRDFLDRVTAKASEDNIYTVEEAASDILDAWSYLYEHDDAGGLDPRLPQAGPIEDDPDFSHAFEEQARS